MGARQQSRFIAMMDNYDRTMELVNVAYDSNGKATEQFGKYSDTLEYKLNQLTNTWEQMRLKFLNSEFLKNVVDQLTNLLKKFEDFNIKDIAVLVGVWLTFGKKAIQNFITGMQQSSAGIQVVLTKIMSKASNWISTQTSKLSAKYPKLFKIGFNTDEAETQLAEITKELNVLKNKIIEVDGQEITVGVALEGLSIDQMKNMVKQYEQEFKMGQQNAAKFGYSSEESSQYATNAAKNATGLTYEEFLAMQGSIKEKDLQNKIAERKKVMSASATAIGQSFGVAFTAAVTSVMTEASPGEAFGNIFISGLTTVIPQVISVATTMGAAAAAATGGISVLITLIVGAATTLYSYTKQLKKERIEASYLASTVGANQKAIENLTEQHEKLNDIYLEESYRLNELQNNYNDLETAVDSYIDLNEQILLSTEEREELLSLEEDIASMSPELVDYYDSEGNAILKNIEYLKEYLELKKEEMLLQQQETLKAKNDVNVNEFRTAASENEIATEQRDFFNSEYANQLMTRKWDPNEGEGEGIGNTISAWVEKIANGDEQAENDAHALMSAIKTYDEAWYNELVEGLEDDNGVVEPEDFLEAYAGNVRDKGGGDSSNSLNEEYQSKLLKVQAAAGKEAQNTTSKLKEQKEQIDENYNSLVRLEIETDKNNTITNKNVQELIISGTKAKMGIDGSLTDTIDAKIRNAHNGWFSGENGQGDILEEYIDEYNTEMANMMEDYSNEISDSYKIMVNSLKDSNGISKLEKIYEDAENNGWDAIDILNQISTQFSGNENILGAAANRYSEQISQYNENLKDIANIMEEDEPTETNGLGMYIVDDPNTFTGWYTNLSSATQQAISTGIKKASEIGGPVFGKQFAQDVKNAIEIGTIDENIFAIFQNSDIFNENNSIFDIEKSKNKFIKDVQELGYSIDEAKFQWENLYAFSQSYGTINFKITTDAALEDMTTEVEDSLNTIVTSYDKVSSYLSTQLSEGGIDLSGFTALRDEVASIGLDIDNYVTGMQNGLYQINFDALTQAYHEQVDSQVVTVEAIEAEIDARIAAIDALLSENTSEVNLQNAVVDTTDAIWAQAEAMAEVANMAAKARAEQEGGGTPAHYTVTRTNDVKPKSLSDEQRIALKQERDDLLALKSNKKAMQELADQRNAQQAAHTQISNKEADAIDKVAKANKGGSSAAKDAAEAADKLREAQEKLNEALYGTENYKNAADHLANYTERLEELTEKADKAKESLENLGKEDSASELIATYAENVKLDNITRTAENQVLQQSMDDLLKILNEQYSEYFQKVGDTWMWNASVVDAKMNDHEKDFIIESIENLNEYQDKINENLDAIEEREKEFKEMRKTALESRITLEEEVMDVLKENYQKEIDAAQEKYDALKEADDNYLDALEEAINKQRELRDRANQYEDLAQKERKLALKQRDTSGTNRKDTLQLQKEIEDSRQEMLDNEVDRLLDSMKEMYELQQESREAELEYMNAMMENGQLLQEANEIIASFSTREDMLAWFFENNKELADMSVAATEKYKMELEEMYDAAELYYAMSETNLEELTSFTEEEVSNTVATIGETLTLEAERSYNEMRETVDKEVEDARKAVEDAAKSAADAVGGAASAIGSAADYIKSKYDEITNNSTNLFDIATPTATGLEEQRKGEAAAAKKQYENSYAGLKSAEYTKEANDKAKKIKAVKTTISNSLSSLSHNPNITYGGTFGKFELRIDGNKYTLPTDPFSAKSFGNSLKNIDESLYTIYNGSVRMSLRDYLNKVIPKKTGGTSSGGGGGGNYRGITKNKNGGLVDYTGLAWVDGTTTEPEAFLSADDTKRIGEAAKLLSNLPILNSTSSASTQLSTNVGDTSIEIHINVESISSDYDVDRLAERIKSDIVDASKPVGTPVILKR